jgi:cell division protein FtsI (penicillin-binding protein 3)
VVVLAVLAAWPVWKLLGVLFAEGDSLAARGVAQSLREEPLPAARGAIRDRDGVELAISLPRERLAVNLAHLDDLERKAAGATDVFVATMADTTGMSETRLRELMAAAAPRDPWVVLVDEATPEQADATRAALLEDGVLDALVTEATSVRVHPAGESGLRLVGTVGPDGPGPSAGVERTLDDLLRGEQGTKVVQEGRDGSAIPGTEEVSQAPVPGADVWLTIDRSIQYEAERILLRGAAEASAGGGVAVVGRPSTGELLAVASVERDPTTGELRLSESPKAFADAHQAGSVFKVVTVAAAIEAGVVGLDTALSVPDHLQVYDRTFTDHDPHATQAMTVEQIIAQSSNVGTIKIAQSLGAERLHAALEGFGFGRRSGIANPAESAGVLPELQRWTGPDLAASAIGTHQAATAVQLWAAYNVIANDGRYVAPHLVQRVERAGATLPSPETGGSREVISPETAAQVEAALRAVVTEGTGKRWDLPGYPVAAKTGTGRMPSPERADALDGYLWTDGRYHYLTAFAGYLPADDPQVSITVLLEDVAPGLTGSSGAGPVFSELSRLSIRELGVTPSTTRDGSATSSEVLRAEPAGRSDPTATTVPSPRATTTVAAQADDG